MYYLVFDFVQNLPSFYRLNLLFQLLRVCSVVYLSHHTSFNKSASGHNVFLPCFCVMLLVVASDSFGGFVCLFCFLETGFYCIVLGGPEFAM